MLYTYCVILYDINSTHTRGVVPFDFVLNLARWDCPREITAWSVVQWFLLPPRKKRHPQENMKAESNYTGNLHNHMWLFKEGEYFFNIVGSYWRVISGHLVLLDLPLTTSAEKWKGLLVITSVWQLSRWHHNCVLGGEIANIIVC